MKNKLWIMIIVLVAIVAVGIFVRNRSTASLVSPGANKTTSKDVAKEVPSATPDAPKTYNYDSTTDLKIELDSINPQVLESDFE